MIHILKENVRTGDVFLEDSKIVGVTSRGFGTTFTSYVLDIPEWSHPKAYDKKQNIIITWVLTIGILLIIILIGFLWINRKKKESKIV